MSSELENYLVLIERDRDHRPAEALLADEIQRLRCLIDSSTPPEYPRVRVVSHGGRPRVDLLLSGDPKGWQFRATRVGRGVEVVQNASYHGWVPASTIREFCKAVGRLAKQIEMDQS